MPSTASVKEPNSSTTGEFADKIKVLAGLLVAGFAGALNFIGLTNGEVSDVLRNEAHWPTLILALLVAGILTAVASIFVNPRKMARPAVWMAVAAALVIPVSLSVSLFRIRGVTSPGETTAGWVVAGGAAAFAVLCLTYIGLRSDAERYSVRAKHGYVNLQGLLVFAAIALSATATYAALRLETVSQLTNTAAQLSATVSERASIATVRISVDASKMANADRVYVSLTGFARDRNISQFCRHVGAVGSLGCAQAPCFTAKYGHQNRAFRAACTYLVSGVYQPNAEGSVAQTLVLPVSDEEYQRLELIGEICAGSGHACTYQDSPVTRLDLEVPS